MREVELALLVSLDRPAAAGMSVGSVAFGTGNPIAFVGFDVVISKVVFSRSPSRWRTGSRDTVNSACGRPKLASMPNRRGKICKLVTEV
jgi:hypothetical protein